MTYIKCLPPIVSAIYRRSRVGNRPILQPTKANLTNWNVNIDNMYLNAKPPAVISLDYRGLQVCLTGQRYRLTKLELPFATESQRGIIAARVASCIVQSAVRLTSPVISYAPDYLSSVSAWDTSMDGSEICIWDPYKMFTPLQNKCPRCDCSDVYNQGLKEAGRLVKTAKGSELWIVARQWSCKNPGREKMSTTNDVLMMSSLTTEFRTNGTHACMQSANASFRTTPTSAFNNCLNQFHNGFRIIRLTAAQCPRRLFLLLGRAQYMVSLSLAWLTC